MKNKSYYEILGIPPHVGSGQIQAAYRFARNLYTGDGAATYGFLDAGERAKMLDLVDEAYAALSNPGARRDYDAHINLVNGIPAARAAEAQATAAGDRTRLHAPVAAREAPLPLPPTDLDLPPIAVPEFVNGKVLRDLRESRGMSLDQIAALSKIGKRFLSALEEDRHAAVPGRVFARGFLIEFARAIRAPENELVERYLRNWSGR